MNDLIHKDTDKKTYENATLQITNRLISSEDYVMQIHNISQAGIGAMPRERPSPIIVMLFMLVAAYCFFINSLSYGGNVTMIGTGVCTILTLLIYLLYIFQKEKKYGLTIEMNSGRHMFFISDNREFLRSVLRLVYQQMQSSDTGSTIYIAHFEKGSIDQRTQHVVNEQGTVNIDTTVVNAPHRRCNIEK